MSIAERRKVPVSDALALVDRHLQAFNHGVHTGDFSDMLALYAATAEFRLAEPVATLHWGIDAIRAAYLGDPPKGTMQLRNATVTGDSVTADYFWDAEPDRNAGQLIFTLAEDRIARLVVTFADD